jgi:hypothetical protein
LKRWITQRIVLIALLLLFSYLCVVVKEHAELQLPESFKPRPSRFGKSLFHQVLANPARLRALHGGAATSFASLRKLVGVTGFEPVTLRLSSACSNQLSYTPIKPKLALASRERRLVELRGFEPLTYSLQSCRSTN